MSTMLQWVSNREFSPVQASTPTPRRPLVRRELITDERIEQDAVDECITQDVGINTDLPVLEKIEQLEGRIVVWEREIKLREDI